MVVEWHLQLGGRLLISASTRTRYLCCFHRVFISRKSRNRARHSVSVALLLEYAVRFFSAFGLIIFQVHSASIRDLIGIFSASQKLGGGFYSEVFCGSWNGGKDNVAAKKLRSKTPSGHTFAEAEVLAMLRQEAQILEKLQHEYVSSLSVSVPGRRHRDLE